jgi:hypothetical protein
MRNTIPVYTISLPEYTVEYEPDYQFVGSQLDTVVETHFPGKWMAIRGIGLIDHQDMSLDELVATIMEIGTDQYNPNREGVHAAMFKDFTIHLHATPCLVTEQGLRCPHYDAGGCDSVMGKVVSDFYGGTLYDRGYAIRLDILMVYALDELEPVRMHWTPEGPAPSPGPPSPTESCAFIFKHPDQKRKALVGIIKILR